METSQRGRLSEHFAQLSDPRVDRTPRHLLLDIVVMAGCAVMCGADTWVDIEESGRAKYAWLKRFLPRPRGIPSHETLARVLARLRPKAFRTCFLAWFTAVQERRGGPGASSWVTIDGKATRPSCDRAIDRGPLPMVSAWATAAHLVLGQVAVAPKSDAMTAIPP